MKYLKNLLTAGMLLTNITIFADNPEPYLSVRNLLPTPYYVEDGYALLNLITTQDAATVVDVGSADGGFARYIAQQASSLPSLNKIYSISDWSADQSNKHPFQNFLSNVVQENTSSLIVPIRMSPLEAASALNIKADFIYVNSSQDVYKDILAWYPHLNNAGTIAGNNWNDSSVEMGVTKAAQDLDLNLQLTNNVWYFTK